MVRLDAEVSIHLFKKYLLALPYFLLDDILTAVKLTKGTENVTAHKDSCQMKRKGKDQEWEEMGKNE